MKPVAMRTRTRPPVRNAWLAVAALYVGAISACVATPSGAAESDAPMAAPVYTRDASFPQAAGISFGTVSWVRRDPSSGLIHVLQRSAPPVTAWSTDGRLVSRWTTSALGFPHSISFQTGPSGTRRVWITDMAPPLLAGQGYGHCVKGFDPEGRPQAALGQCGIDTQGSGLDPLQFDKVTDLAANSVGELFVTDGDVGGLNNRVLKLDAGGRVLASWSAPGNQPGSGRGQFNLPHAVVVDRCDRVWVADALNHRVQVLDRDGAYLGAITSFGGLGVYALAFGEPSAQAVLFAGASPTTGGGTGRVSLFAVPMDCTRRTVADVAAFASFDIPLPASSSTTLLHALTVDPATWDVYVALLGSAVPPQKWVASWPGGGRPRSQVSKQSGPGLHPTRQDTP